MVVQKREADRVTAMVLMVMKLKAKKKSFVAVVTSKFTCLLPFTSSFHSQVERVSWLNFTNYDQDRVNLAVLRHIGLCGIGVCSYSAKCYISGHSFFDSFLDSQCRQ